MNVQLASGDLATNEEYVHGSQWKGNSCYKGTENMAEMFSILWKVRLACSALVSLYC
jgi:cephalosporin hydroxylase